MPSPRLLITTAGESDLDELPFGARLLIEAAAEILVVVPALPTRLQWLTSDTDKTREVADERLGRILAQMRGTPLGGFVGADDPLLAFEDAVARFDPHHILIALRASGDSDWQEPGLVEEVLKR